jgi:hypothetical protein
MPGYLARVVSATLLVAAASGEAALVARKLQPTRQRLSPPVEAGRPMTANGRTRRAFTVWLAAIDRLEKHLRLVGLQRVSRQALSLAEVMANAE